MPHSRHHHRRSPPEPDSVGGSERWLLAAVDCGLAGAIGLVPLCFGGRAAWGQLLLVALATGLAVAWCVRQMLRRESAWALSGAEWLMLGALGLVALQQVPLPADWIRGVSPPIYRILPLWSPDTPAEERLGVWTTLSWCPAETANGMAALACYAIIFLVASQRIQRVEDAARLLRWIAIGAGAMAALGLAQYFLGNGKFLWMFEHPEADTYHAAKGSFSNRNHFAQFVVLGLGPIVWWALERTASARRRGPAWRSSDRQAQVAAMLLAGLAAISVLAVLLSFSRGGALAMFIAAGVCLTLVYRAGRVDGRTLAFIAATGTLVAAALGFYGYQMVADRLDDLQSIDALDGSHQRRGLWKADLAAAADFLATGTGVGSHRHVYPRYLPDNEVTQHYEYTHAENGYLQVALETGLPGLALLAAGLLLVGRWCWGMIRSAEDSRIRLCAAAIVPSLAASALHSLVDFVWYIPGCLILVLLLAACAWRLQRLARGNVGQGLAVPGAAWALALGGALWFGYSQGTAAYRAVRASPDWNRFLVASRRLPTLDESARPGALESMEQQLANVIEWCPRHAAAHARLAEVHLRLFDLLPKPSGTMGVRQLRQTAIAAAEHFPSPAAREDWLNRVLGPQGKRLKAAAEHARRALELCPLEARAYLTLAMIGPLDGCGRPGIDACVEQALAVRPWDGSVLFEAGQESLLAGRAEQAVERWRQSFQCGSLHQDRLFDLLTAQMPASFFLESFPMDRLGLRRLEARFRAEQRPEEAHALLLPRARAAREEADGQTGPKAAWIWLDAADAHGQLGQAAEQRECLQSALRCDGSHFEARRALGRALLEAGQLGEAEEHLRWCLRRKPQDPGLRAMVEAAVERRLRTTSLESPRR